MIQVEKRLFNVEDYYKMADTGIIRPEDRVELIRGEIFKMSPIRSRHSGMINLLTELIFKDLLGKVVIAIQNPLRIDSFSEPELDLLVAKYRKDKYRHRHPRPEDALLVLEVADSSLHFDRNTKGPLYAAAGIPEYWIVNLPDEQVEVFRLPVDGRFQSEEIFTPGQTVRCSSIELAVEVSELFE